MKIFYILILMFSFFSKSLANYDRLAYDYKFESLNGPSINLSEYKDKIIVIVNVASRCGFTNQYNDLQKLWVNYEKKGLVVIGVPSNNFKQEPGTNEEIKQFCESNFNITFPISEKINVIGENAHPFFKWARENYGASAIPKWNFHKIIVKKDGKIGETFGSLTKPYSKKFLNYIEKEIKN
ncbi:MAG: glutathione peroxidase [Pelagibacteraceae bacterium]